jgi:hypothetical protein
VNSKIDRVASIQNADFGFLGRRLAFVGFALSKIGDCGGGLPQWVVQRSVELRRMLDASRIRFRRPRLGLGAQWHRGAQGQESGEEALPLSDATAHVLQVNLVETC